MTIERNPFLQLLLARMREFGREPEVLFWVFGFPILLAVGLGIAFRNKPAERVAVGVLESPGAESLAKKLASAEGFDVERVPPEQAAQRLRLGKVALIVVAGDPPEYRYDPTRPDSLLARGRVDDVLQKAAGRADVYVARETTVSDPGARYIDFLIPGLIGLNLLGAGMWGVGFNLVQMRTQNLLRRLSVTPMRRREFLLGYLLGRFVLVVPEALAIALFGVFLWGVPFRGSLLAGALLVLVAGFAFAGLGCLLASRARTIEGIAGLMNLFQLPMWLLGGTFFDNERLTGVVKWAAEAMPLTHANRALRDVMLAPGTVADVAWPLGGLAAFAVLCFACALRIFRWQ